MGTLGGGGRVLVLDPALAQDRVLAHGMLAIAKEVPAMIWAILLVMGVFALMACRRPGPGDYLWGR